jgi:hypothetical protein
MAVDLEKAAARADKALTEVAEALAAVKDLVVQAVLTEKVIVANESTLEAQRAELRRLETSISSARDRYLAAKDETRKVQETAVESLESWQRELAEARVEADRKKAAMVREVQEAEDAAGEERRQLQEQMGALREALAGLERLREQARKQLA